MEICSNYISLVMESHKWCFLHIKWWEVADNKRSSRDCLFLYFRLFFCSSLPFFSLLFFVCQNKLREDLYSVGVYEIIHFVIATNRLRNMSAMKVMRTKKQLSFFPNSTFGSFFDTAEVTKIEKFFIRDFLTCQLMFFLFIIWILHEYDQNRESS